MDGIFAPSPEELAAIVSVDAALAFANVGEGPFKDAVLASPDLRR